MSQNSEYRKIPAVDKLLKNTNIKTLITSRGEGLVKFAIRTTVDELRKKLSRGEELPLLDETIKSITYIVDNIAGPQLRSVINGTGIVLHTNLGRAPLGENLLKESCDVLYGYNNLEFDLEAGHRGERYHHAAPIIKYLTGAEDAVIVNNNAAAVLLILAALARNKEVVVSRGELIEIGGSFRIPDIIENSNCTMVEVGTTNKTKPSDYEKGITENSAILFKAHRSNFSIKGFTQELSLNELSEIGAKHNIPTVYDIGSGLLHKVDSEALKDEPSVREAIEAGIDLVCFSGDKLLGAVQAGIIVGKKKYIDIIKQHPLMRAFRVCKMTLAILEKACSYYLDEKKLYENNMLFSILSRTDNNLLSSAERFRDALRERGVGSVISASEGQYGGGTLPDLTLKSYQVKIDITRERGKEIYHKLLAINNPILTNLKSGYIYVDMLCVQDEQIDIIADSIKQVTI